MKKQPHSRKKHDEKHDDQQILSPEAQKFYSRALDILIASGVAFLVGGAYAFRQYTGIVRHTKDLDIFVRQDDRKRTLNAFADTGYKTQVTSPRWLAKAFCDEHFIDIITSSANGVAPVDDLWFERAVRAEVLDHSVLLVPPEEMIWQKAFIMERERFDGADVAHLILKQGHKLDWPHLLDRFGPYWRVLLGHLIFFEFSYPADRSQIPAAVLDDLLERERTQRDTPDDADFSICYGTLFSDQQYVADVERWGYEDARSQMGGETPEQAEKRREADDHLHIAAS